MRTSTVSVASCNRSRSPDRIVTAKLLAEYGDLDGVYAAVDSMKASRMKQNLIENKDLAYLSKTLATIKLDCPIPFEFSEATYHPSDLSYL